MNVLFLDYDGVVNTPMWDETGEKCTYNFPQDNKVNNFQCVQWVSEFCQKYGYSIVVSSSWRNRENYRECLLNGGLRDGIEILGKTPNLPGTHGSRRGDEIQMWLDEHPEVDVFIILDDESNVGHLADHLIKCNTTVGFTLLEFMKAEELHWKLDWNNKNEIEQ